MSSFALVIRDAEGLICKRLPVWGYSWQARKEAEYWRDKIAQADKARPASYSIGLL